MNNNPFLAVLKILFTAVLAVAVFLAFWQKTHVEDQLARLQATSDDNASALKDLRRDLNKLATAPPGPAAGPAPKREWGWELNASLDAAADPSKPVGTAGRYKNFLTLDPDPEYPAEAKPGGVVSVPYGEDPKGFNFIVENAAELTEQLEQYVTDSPASSHWANPYKFAPALCWRIEVSPDFREYTLFFRRDVLWHEPPVDLKAYPHLKGEHRVTARDYKFTLDIINNPQTDCAPLRGYYTEMEDSRLIDDWTVVVRWKETVWHSIDFTIGRAPMPEFIFGYSESGKRLPPETIGQQFNEHWFNQKGVCGCGPYRMVSYDVGKWITLERFEDYYRAAEGVRYPIDGRRMLIYKDPETAFLKLQAGELSLTGLTSAQYKKAFVSQTPPAAFAEKRLLGYKYPRSSYYYFGWKNTHPLFRDPNVRRALALACNRFDIGSKIFIGRIVPMAGPVFPGSPQADPEMTPLPFDMKQAEALLDEAGWKKNASTGIREKTVDGELRKFEFKILWSAPSPDVEAAINQYKNDLLSIGIVMESDPVEWTLWQKRAANRQFEAVFGGWSTSGWDHDFDQIWHSRQIKEPNGSNYIEFSNPEVDRLSEDLRREMDPAKRIEKVRKIGRILFEAQPTCFIGWATVFGAHDKDLQNVTGHLFKTRPNLRTFPMWFAR